MVRCFLFFVFGCISATAFPQVLEFSEPEKLAATVNSDDEESMPLLSPDGKMLFFTRSLHAGNKGGKYAGQDIWISKFEGGGWRKADGNIFPFNDRTNNAVVGMSTDGKTLYLLHASPSKKIKGISFSRKINGIWMTPEAIPLNGLETDGSIGFYVSPDFDVIFIAMKGSDTRGEEDLYVSTKGGSGEWSKPKNLGATINTSGFEIAPFLSQDKKRLYFSSNGHPGMGDADIFYSDRLYDSWETWSVPRNLGKVVNSGKFDAYLSSGDDSVFYFSSNRSGRTSDLYKVTKMAAIKTNGLTTDRIFLSQVEIDQLFGTETDFTFTIPLTEISQQQGEQLNKIANVLNNKKEIKIHLITRKSRDKDELELNKERLFVVLTYLKRLGIEGSRVTFGTEADAVVNEKEIIFRFYY